MKKVLLILVILFGIPLSAQIKYSVIFEKKYSDIPVKMRTENSGVYFISSFDIDKDNVWLTSFDSGDSYCYNNNKITQKESMSGSGKDFTAGVKTLQKSVSKMPAYKYGNVRYKKIFAGNSVSLLSDADGILTDGAGNSINISIKDNSLLKVSADIASVNKSLEVNIPGGLAYADLIGIDKNGSYYFLIESYITQIPLKVKRQVYTISQDGNILSVLEIPSIKYFYTVRDFQIDADGNLYHLLSEKDKLSIIKWSGLSTPVKSIIKYPSDYNYEFHYNNLEPVKEPEFETVREEKTAVSRSSALRIGETYVLNKYACTAANLAPSDVTGPDGDVVRTPAWLIVGANSKIPYKWGGFNTIAQFNSGMTAGKYAGDINTAGVSSYAVGVDCSGFVSRCWQLSSHYSTSAMPGITTLDSGWTYIKPADAVLKNGHVRMFVDWASNGALRIVESSGRDWGVSYWTYTPSDLTAYAPRCYNSMAADYSLKQPVMTSAVMTSGTTVKICWTCDTTGIKGYRLYKSTDGLNWSLALDENTLKGSETVYAPANNTEYYRISSVMNNSALTESNWSNILGISKKVSTKKILIVDGFNRDGGNWRGNGHPFCTYYGKGLNALDLRFESVKNTEIIDSSTVLNNYDAVYWILGDESTVNETFSSDEQNRVKNYLENGGKLFVSGSEIGWDLGFKGSASDKDFYNNYLKSAYVSDNAGSLTASGVAGTAFSGLNFNFGQGYDIPYPDEIGISGGSTLCLQYGNSKGAGVQYTGPFGTSAIQGKVICLGFPLETVANDSLFNSVIRKSIYYFFPELNGISDNMNTPVKFELAQNYPNPFNPATVIKYSIPQSGLVTLRIYDVLGNEVKALVNGMQTQGEHIVNFNAAGLSSGIYFYTIKAGSYTQTRKMMLIK
jgi:hypothetical protein